MWISILKLRAWDIRHKEMTYIDDLYWFEEEGIHDFDGRGHHSNYIFMWSTELKDKNNKDIYDGDIIKGRDPLGFQALKLYGAVVFKNGSFVVKGKLMNHANWQDYYEDDVIGNIYENPELL